MIDPFKTLLYSLTEEQKREWAKQLQNLLDSPEEKKELTHEELCNKYKPTYSTVGYGIRDDAWFSYSSQTQLEEEKAQARRLINLVLTELEAHWVKGEGWDYISYYQGGFDVSQSYLESSRYFGEIRIKEGKGEEVLAYKGVKEAYLKLSE